MPLGSGKINVDIGTMEFGGSTFNVSDYKFRTLSTMSTNNESIRLFLKADLLGNSPKTTTIHFMAYHRFKDSLPCSMDITRCRDLINCVV